MSVLKTACVVNGLLLGGQIRSQPMPPLHRWLQLALTDKQGLRAVPIAARAANPP